MKKISVNQFNKGLNLDNNPVSVSNDSLIGALNATFITKNGNEVVLQNDMGNASVDKAQLPAGYVPLGAKEHGGIIYVASYNPLTDESQIGCFPSPQRNFATESDSEIKNIGSLCNYVGQHYKNVYYYSNKTYEQRIINIPESSDNIIRAGDKFIITSNDCGDLELKHELIRLRVLVVTSDNQSIDITDELTEPSGNFEHVPFVKDIFHYPDILDSDYTVYTNRTCGQLYLKAELILPDYFEVSYSANYNPTNNKTTLAVNFTSYKNGEEINWPGGYFGILKINNVEYPIIGGNPTQILYDITGITEDSLLEFTYYPVINFKCGNNNDRYLLIEQLKKLEQIEFSLIGSGKVTFDIFRYFNDFDNNHLVFNYGLKFYQRDSDYKLTDLYLELINLRDLDAVSWNYNNVNLTKKRIPLNTDNIYGVYTETIDYLSVQQIDISSSNTLISTDLINNDDKIATGQYYLARICAEVNGTTLYKGDWHALLTSEATNYLYEDGIEEMLNLFYDQNSDYNTELIMNYDLIKSNEDYILNDNEELTDDDNYFVIDQPSPNEIMRYEVKKSGELNCIHEASAKLIIPKHFPFTESEITYNPQVSCEIGNNNSVDYQDDIITDGTYNPTNKVKHYNNITIHNDQNIGGNDSETIAERNGRNKLFYQSFSTGGRINLHFTYELYSQLISPFSSQPRSYSETGPAFISYASRLSSELLKLPIDDSTSNKIYPDKALCCIYYRTNFSNTRTIIGTSNYIKNNEGDPFIFVNDTDNNFQEHIRRHGVYECDDFEISNLLNSNFDNPNIAILSSCVNGASDVYPYGRSFPSYNTYDMLLIRGIDNNLYLIKDIAAKGILLSYFNEYFSNIYIYKPEQSISLTYWTGDNNNYFATNDYKIYLSYDMNYKKDFNPEITISVHDNSIVRMFDEEYIKLPLIKFNKFTRKEHFRKIISSNSISERVSNFLNNQRIIIGNIAKIINNQQVTYKLNAVNGNTKTPLNDYDCYILENGELINCKDYTTGSGILYSIAQKIKNNQLVLNDQYELVLNNDIIPQWSETITSEWEYGQPSNVNLKTIFPRSNFKNFKLFENA